MNIKNFLCISILTITLTAQSGCFKNSDPWWCQAVDKAVARCAKRIATEENLNFFGLGGGIANGKKTIVSAAFISSAVLTQSQARQLIISTSQELIDCIGANPKTREYLVAYPFPTAALEVEIFVMDAQGNHPQHPEIAVVSMRNNTIYYRTATEDPKRMYESETSESYEEALRIVEAEQHRLPETLHHNS